MKKEIYNIKYKYNRKQIFTAQIICNIDIENRDIEIISAKILPGFDVTDEFKLINKTQLVVCLAGHEFMEWGTGTNGIEKIAPDVRCKLDEWFNDLEESKRILEDIKIKNMSFLEKIKYFFTKES